MLSLGLFVSCSDQEKETPTPNPKVQAKKEAPKKAEAKKPETKKADPKSGGDGAAKVTVNADGVAELTIEATDMMKFTAKNFTVTEGQKVKLTLKNIGSLPIEAMGHNLVVLKTDINVDTFAPAVAGKEFPEDKKDSTIAYTKMLGGGESDTIEFVAPAAGTYKFICTWPAHVASMQGEMIVTAKK